MHIFAKLSCGISYFAENNNVVPVSSKETFVFWIYIVITDDKSVLFKKWLGAVRQQTIATLPEPMLTTVRDIVLRRHASINCIQDRPQSISAILTQPHCIDICYCWNAELCFIVFVVKFIVYVYACRGLGPKAVNKISIYLSIYLSFACTYEEKPINPLCPSLITDHAEVL